MICCSEPMVPSRHTPGILVCQACGAVARPASTPPACAVVGLPKGPPGWGLIAAWLRSPSAQAALDDWLNDRLVLVEITCPESEQRDLCSSAADLLFSVENHRRCCLDCAMNTEVSRART